MGLAVDHVFVCVSRDAPEAELLRGHGLVEGPPNRHPGQGTACRRFYFENAMLELIWLADRAEAQSPQTARTLLYERFTGPASPFGVILRPDADGGECPFAAWNYEPPTMPGLSLRVAAEVTLDEPMWCYLPIAYTRPVPPVHPAGFRALQKLRLHSPPPAAGSVTMAMARTGVIEWRSANSHHLELHFDGVGTTSLSLSPQLPLSLHG